MPEIKFLEWDTEFFGIPIASIYPNNSKGIKSILKGLSAENIQLAYVFLQEQSKPIDELTLKNYGGLLTDRKVTYSKTISNTNKSQKHSKIRINYYTNLNENLINLAIISGKHSRYCVDSNFSKEQFRSFFTTWMQNSINKKLADYVITFHEENEPLGMVTLKKDGHIGRIGLIGVSDKNQSKGIGSALINQCVTICQQNGISNIEVVTQTDNEIACRFYEKNEFVKSKTEQVYHFWLKKNDPI